MNPHIASRLLILFLCLHMGLWSVSHNFKTDLSILENAPDKNVINALSLGDEQYIFRFLALDLQNAGDTYGRITPLKHYNYANVISWFRVLDYLDPESNIVPAMASYYYSQTQNEKDVPLIIDYLMLHAAHAPLKKWWWMYQAVYIALHRLHDTEKALSLAYILADVEGKIPLWARQMPAFILERNGEKEASLRVIQKLLDESHDLSIGELNFMRHFIQERIQDAKTPSL